MSRYRLFFILVALALLVIGGLTVISAINTMEITNRVGTLTDGKSETIPSVSGGQPTTIPATLDVFANQEWLMGLAIIGIVAFVIGWHLFWRNVPHAHR